MKHKRTVTLYAVLCMMLLGCNHHVTNDTSFAIVLPGGEQNQSNWKEIDGIAFYDSLLWSPEEVKKFEPNWSKHEEVLANTDFNQVLEQFDILE